jgi:hypothetical protein
MLGSLRFAFSLFPFLMLLWDKRLISMVVTPNRIGVSAWRKLRLAASMSPALQRLAAVFRSIAIIGRTWFRDSILHAKPENRGVWRLGRPWEIASTRDRRGDGWVTKYIFRVCERLPANPLNAGVGFFFSADSDT